jgi:hypothetical protein
VADIWPNFFVVGAAKAGTTSLYAYLKQHPQIFLPKVKEPHFFTQVCPAPEMRHLYEAITDRPTYLSLFRKARGYRAIGDASPSYLWHPQAAERIRHAVSDARIIITLRDPVERAHSHYLADVREGVHELSFYEALRQDMARPRKGWAVSLLYVELGQYAAQVQRYLELFGPKRVKVLLFDDLTRDSARVLSELALFLDVDPDVVARIDVNEVHNSYAAPRGKWARRLAGAKISRLLGKTVIPRSLGQLIFERVLLTRAPKPRIEPDAKRLLCEIYEPDVRQLEVILGRPLPELRRSW